MRRELEKEYTISFHSSYQWYGSTSAPVIFFTSVIFIARLRSILACRWRWVPRLTRWVPCTWTASGWERRYVRNLLVPITPTKRLQELLQEQISLLSLPVWGRTWAVVRTHSRVVWTRRQNMKHHFRHFLDSNEEVYVRLAKTIWGD